MGFQRHILLTAVAGIPAFLLGCGTVGTYYPKPSAPQTIVRHTERTRPQRSRAADLETDGWLGSTAGSPQNQGPMGGWSRPQGAPRTKGRWVAGVDRREPPDPRGPGGVAALRPQPPDNPNRPPAEILPVEFEPERTDTQPTDYDGEPAAVPLPEPDATIQPLQTTGMTLEQLESLALQHNPSVKQASTAANKALALRKQVGLAPNPQLSYFAEEMGSESSGGLQGAALSQTFLTRKKRELNQRVIDEDYQSVLWEVEAQRYRVRTDVRTKFYQALAAQRRTQLAQDFRQVAEQGRQVAQDRLQALEGAKPDLLQTEIQLSEVEIIQRKAEVEYQAAWNALTTVVGLPDMAPATLQGELPVHSADRDLDVLYQQLLGASPELKAALARVNAARETLKRQDIQAIPILNGRVGVGQDNANGNNFANVQLSIPLPIHNRNQGNIQAAYADYCRATQDVARLKLAIRSRLVQALQNYNQARVTVDQYANVILPKAKESMDLTEQAYLADQFDFLRVLTARRTYFETNLAYVQARAELATAEAQIDGLLLSGGLNEPAGYNRDDSLRQQMFNIR